MHSTLMHVVTNGNIFICMPEQYLIVFAYIPYLLICLKIFWFHVLTIVNNVAMNLEVQISLQDILRCSLRYIVRSVIFYYFDSSLLNFFRNFHIVSHSVCMNYILTNSTRVFQLLHILVNPYYFYLFIYLFFVKRHHWFNGYLIGEFTCLKQGSGATPHYVWQMVCRTWQQSAYLVSFV